MFLNKNNTLNYKKIAIGAVVVFALCILGVIWFDAPLFVWMRGFDWAPWAWADAVFSTKVWLGISVLGLLVTGIIKNKKISKKKFELKTLITNPFALVFCSVTMAAIISGILKVLLGRMRPVFYEALSQTGFYPFNFEWAFNSMPSGHTAASFAGLVMLAMLVKSDMRRVNGKAVGIWTLAIVIGFSRVAHGAHWPTDVILGAFIGMVAADIVYSLKNKI